MTQPIKNLLRLQELAETQGEPDLAAWLGDSLQKYLFERQTLEQALGAAGGQGKRTARQTYLERRRNRALRAAWRLCEGKTPWRRTLALQKEIKRFQTVLWPRWEDLPEPPPGITELRCQLFIAHRCGSVPTSTSRLDEICTIPINPLVSSVKF